MHAGFNYLKAVIIFCDHDQLFRTGRFYLKHGAHVSAGKTSADIGVNWRKAMTVSFQEQTKPRIVATELGAVRKKISGKQEVRFTVPVQVVKDCGRQPGKLCLAGERLEMKMAAAIIHQHAGSKLITV